MAEEDKLVPFPRKTVPKSIRFAVFKRDAFTCQYCGGKAPDVLLTIDHIKAVADGGENEPVNLVTACSACNSGKSRESLDENAVIEKQRRQLEELNERRNQLELMLEWREGLRGLEGEHIAALQDALVQYGKFRANESGEQHLRRWLKQYGLKLVLEAIETSFSQYLREDDPETWERAFQMIGRIAGVEKRGGMPPEKMRLFYIRGILRRRFDLTEYYNWQIIPLLQEAVDHGIDLDFVESFAKSVSSKTTFRNSIIDFIAENSGDDDG